MNIAVIGAGFWSRYQIAGWHEIPGVRCVAITDRDAAKAQTVAEEFGMNFYPDAKEMLASEKAKLVDIITNVEAHREGVELAASFGLPVVCQKPMGVTLEEARGMVQRCRDAGVPFFVNENWRYQAPIQAAKQALEQVGKIHRARITFSCSFPVFDNQPALRELERFIITDIGSHILDVARLLFGEAKSLTAHTTRVNPAIQGEDVATVILHMERCPTVICEMSYASRLRDEAFPQTYLVVEGERGSVEIRKDYELIVTTEESLRHRVEPQTYPWANPAYALVHASIVDCQRAILDDLKGVAPSGLRGEENLRTLELMFGAYDAAAESLIVTL